MTADRAAEQRSLLEIEALLAEIRVLRNDGDAERFATDYHYRWVLHRLWIAVGNEALAYTGARGMPVRKQPVWANLYDLRNHLAHTRLPDIDEGLVQRFTWTRIDSLLGVVGDLLRPGA